MYVYFFLSLVHGKGFSEGFPFQRVRITHYSNRVGPSGKPCKSIKIQFNFPNERR